jgi:threonine 3-dehydrogenase
MRAFFFNFKWWKFISCRSLLEFMSVPEEKLKRRVYNVTAMSFTPEELADKIAQHVPQLSVSYNPDSRQGERLNLAVTVQITILSPSPLAIADDWPQVFDDSEARADWGWKHEYDIDRLVTDILKDVGERMKKH